MAIQPTYLAIDLKSFYASVECAEYGLDPLDANLVVADESRTTKTICLAVSPALKQFGVSGRARLYKVIQRIDQLNRERTLKMPHHRLSAVTSIYRQELKKNPEFRVGFRIVKPRMGFYLKKSAEIYEIYLRYLPPEKIHVYSIDEVLMDVTDYLVEHHVSARVLAKEIIQTIKAETQITATAGIGTNLFLAKVAMDIVAKRIPGDEDGVRIAQMTEYSFRRYLWAHQPLTDFWRIGHGYARRLKKLGLNTMGDIARCSLGKLSDEMNEEVLYREFGKNAEIIIDHAWGYEPTTIADIKNYHSSDHGIYSGQVLTRPYNFAETRLIVKEMVNSLALQLTKQGMMTDQIGLFLSYDISNVTREEYQGSLVNDFYGRRIPKPMHATIALPLPTASATELMAYFMQLYDTRTNRQLTTRKITVIANHLLSPAAAQQESYSEQLDLFMDTKTHQQSHYVKQATEQKDQQLQKLVLGLQQDFGKNVIIRAADLKKSATLVERNKQIGGHQA
ncbi:LytTR family transcriptional regulator [Limosilactobacillus sp. STM2_1]|uniref:LytTR family transcriptional regulator n=1 Tax=Limosilactobacillus rudii TaxID=2759755 RepID=A0A7W3UJ29_9LACO|nr:LytTR family transcriptional regulator [Limosilactobacillus rudii]MBB1080040.1 LytTR family transcriptional regulator [Limosilactobacillus rudii]MBB1096472.1 LytTR family transcriptional regulator [Limosilactobacillus rudii]MCD7133527.1 LytTR family transcriptional regulator [Limosilactobacillus rudii]